MAPTSADPAYDHAGHLVVNCLAVVPATPPKARALVAKGDTARARRVLELALIALRSAAGAGHQRVYQAERLLAEIQPLQPLP